MIKLHKLNGVEIIINAELIESVEATPDTVINLSTGNRFLVKDSVQEVVDKALEYKKKICADKKSVTP